MESPEARHLAIESWTLYAVALLFVAARIASRRILLGSLKKLQADDYIMLFVIVTFTGVIVFINQTAMNLSNYLAPGVFETLTPAEVQNAVYGSKAVFITEEFKLTTVYLCKGCLLFLYSQMTQGLPKQHRLVKVVAVYVVLAYIITQILFLSLWCRPIQQYWQVPVNNSQCASYYHHLITDAVFNISSDLVMLCLPLPLLIKTKIPLKRKAILMGVFSLGVFVILAAVLNRYYNFTSGYGSLIYLNWYAGECATAVIVANIPHCWPLLSRIFSLGSFKASTNGAGSGNRFRPSSNPYPSATTSRRKPSHIDEYGYMKSESEEKIANAGAGAGSWVSHEQGPDGTIELKRMEAPGAFTTTVTGGKDEEDSIGWGPASTSNKSSIVKTVEIQHQYSK